MTRPDLSIIVPAFNEVANLPILKDRLLDVLDGLGLSWEWIVVDDHSTDGTYPLLKALAEVDDRVRVIRFARNFGSYAAIHCGLRHARGQAAVVLAADLQDPPELIPELVAKWRTGTHVVWAARGEREGISATDRGLAQAFYAIMRHIAGIKSLPPKGADFFLLDRRVVEALGRFRESNVHLMALIAWLGFSQDSVTYTKQARLHGTTGWTLRKKIELAVNAVTAFTYMPIRAISYVGAIVALCGFVYGIVVVVTALGAEAPEGWASLMVVFLLVSGIQMLMLGVLGEYLWRTLDEARGRPRYVAEAMINFAESDLAVPSASMRD